MTEDWKEKYADIRPFEPEELPAVYERLMADGQFRQVLSFVFPGVPADAIFQKMKSCRTSMEFQLTMCYDFLDQLMKKLCTRLDLDVTNLDKSSCYTFVSNHRDIVLDSALLDKLLVDTGFTSTCEIAIGDNLLSLPWVKDLVRVNKSFIVRRGLPLREMLLASRHLSEYMHIVINVKRSNIWIAQREGRAKDSDDRTQSSILKMMSMAGEGTTAVERLKELHIVPVSISYEYDPCDFLKAREYQLKRDMPHWKKTAADDVISMRTGVLGYKGKVHYHCGSCIDEWLSELSPDIPKTELHNVIAEHIDSDIHRHYRLFPNNYIALDMLNGTSDNAGTYYSDNDKERFCKYVAAQIARITDVPDKDESYLRERILTMYANPAINKRKASADVSQT